MCRDQIHINSLLNVCVLGSHLELFAGAAIRPVVLPEFFSGLLTWPEHWIPQISAGVLLRSFLVS